MRLFTNLTLTLLIVVGLFFTGCNHKSNQNQDQVVKTTAGDVSGSYNDSVYAFLGIPYAKAERFMPPQAPDAWEGVRESVDFGPVAKQVVPWYPDSVQNEKELYTIYNRVLRNSNYLCCK